MAGDLSSITHESVVGIGRTDLTSFCTPLSFAVGILEG